MAGRLLGMGDVAGLVEKAAEVIDEQEAMKRAEKLKKNQFDFDDFLSQLQMMKKMGGLQDLLGMIPGMGKQMGNMPIDDSKMKQTEAIILSMTPKERRLPQIIKGTRRKRIAAGSGTTIIQVNQLLKQFGQMRKMMKQMGDMGGGGMLGGGGGGFPGGMPRI
jgi:signal recognition particle subunit SRP54